MIRIFIVAGIWLYREGLAHLLAQHGSFSIVGTAPDRRETAAGIGELQPDVVLLDLATPESAAIIRDIKQWAPQVPIVAIAVPDREEDVLSTIEAGVVGYLSRDGSLADLVAVVESSARGELQVSPKFAGSLVRRVAALAAQRDTLATPADPQSRLTGREREIVRLIEQNLSNKEIGALLGIEVATVKNHVHNLLDKLNLHRRLDVAVWSNALRTSMSEIDEQSSKR
jgi:DNA-binding NarL/FixJ family response regulator